MLVTSVSILGGATGDPSEQITCTHLHYFPAHKVFAEFLPISVNNVYTMLLPMASALGGLDRGLFSVIQLVLLAAGLLLLWRLWRFTIRPAMKPDEPRRLPYWIPCGSP